MIHRDVPLSVEGRGRLVACCYDWSVVYVVVEMGILRACALKWVGRHRCYGDTGLLDRSLVPHR